MSRKEESLQSKIEDAFDHAFADAMAKGHGYQVAAKRALKAAQTKAKDLGIPCHITPEEAADMSRLAELCDITEDDEGIFGESDLDGWDY
jgi:hypothetical protein